MGCPMFGLIGLMRDEGAATAIEYALIATFVSIAAIFAMSALGIRLSNMFTFVSSILDDALAAVGLA